MQDIKNRIHNLMIIFHVEKEIQVKACKTTVLYIH